MEAMRVFVAVVETGGFAKAARRLGVSAPTVSRAVSGLEARLGVQLLHRTTRVVAVTDAGERYAADVRRILADVELADAAARGEAGAVRGELRVTAPVLFGTRHVAPVIFEFLRRHPEVTPRLALVDRVVDLIEEGFDVGVRIGHLRDSWLTAVKVGEVRQLVCASPDYLERRGLPRTPGELTRHDAISLPPELGLHAWSFPGGRRSATVTPNQRLVVSSVETAVAAAVAGQGLVRALSYQVKEPLADGSLVTLLDEHAPPPVPVHLLHSGGRHASRKVRAFLEHAVTRLRACEF